MTQPERGLVMEPFCGELVVLRVPRGLVRALQFQAIMKQDISTTDPDELTKPTRG